MSDTLDLKAIRKALEAGAESKKKYEELLLKKGFSEQMIKVLTENLEEVITPVLEKMATSVEDSNKSLVAGITDALKGNETDDAKEIIDAIQSGFRGIRFPTPKIEMKAPDIHIPEPKPLVMPETIRAVLEYDKNNPLPVILMGGDGKPFQPSSFTGGGGIGGGRGDFYTIVDIKGSTSSIIDQIEGALRVTGTLTSTTTPFATYYASDAVGSFNLIQINGNAIAVGIGEANSNSIRVAFATDTVASTYITGFAGTSAANIVDSSGVAYSGTNPLPVTVVTDQTATTVVVGDIPSGTVDTGSAPNKIGGIVRTANPTAEVDGDRVSASFDDVGRQVIRSHQVRDLMKTAYVTLSTGSETTLLGAVSGAFLDLIYIMGANTSSAAVQVDIRATTGGNVVATLYIPGNSTAGVALPVAWPQDNQGNNWTVDMGDITGSNVLISALFSQEV